MTQKQEIPVPASAEWVLAGATPKDRFERFAWMNEESSRRVDALLDELAVLNGDVPERGAPGGNTSARGISNARVHRGRLGRALARVRRSPRSE
jgi:hypothetical protein